MSRDPRRRSALGFGFACVVTACASVTPTPAALTRAQTVYAALEAEHAEQRVEGDMIRARAIIDTARGAVAQGQNAIYIEGVADIALRTAQIAEAHFARAIALAQADSMEKLLLTRQLAAAEARQAALEAQRAALERQAALADARADSLRQAVDATNAQPARPPAPPPVAGDSSAGAPIDSIHHR